MHFDRAGGEDGHRRLEKPTELDAEVFRPIWV